MKHAISEVVLNNGAKGLIVFIPDATVMTFEFNFRAGEYLVERDKWETPHLMEHVLLGANELYPTARSFQAELEKNGAYANASTGSYDITYEAECADMEWDRILGLVLNAISKPLFLEEEFDAEVGNVREELFARSNNHFRHLNLALREKYGFKVMTDQERLKQIENVTRKDVQQHYKNTHSADNMRFVIAGNVTPLRQETIVSMIENIELPKGKGRLALPKEVPRSLRKALYIDVPSVENLYFYIDGFMKRHLMDSEADALNLVNIIYTETLHSRIFGAAREKGLVYGMSTNYSRLIDSSNFWIGAQVMPKNFSKLLDIIIKEINRTKDGKIPSSDLEAAKLFALGRYQRSAQTVSGTAGLYSQRYFYDEVIEDYYEVPNRIKAVTKDAIIDTMNAIFKAGVKGFGVLGSCGDEYTQERYKQIMSLWE